MKEGNKMRERRWEEDKEIREKWEKKKVKIYKKNREMRWEEDKDKKKGR